LRVIQIEKFARKARLVLANFSIITRAARPGKTIGSRLSDVAGYTLQTRTRSKTLQA
jgi:hypothetical protein